MTNETDARQSLSGAHGTNLVVTFLLELAALVALGVWGAHVGPSTLARFGLAAVAVIGWATVWGLCFSPKPRVVLSPVAKASGQWLMFAIAVAAAFGTGHWALASIFAALVFVNRILLATWQR